MPPPLKLAACESLITRALSPFPELVSPGIDGSFRIWMQKLLEWNARVDLTAARTEAELVDLMLADALVLTRHIAPGSSVVDVGTGAGAPGLALAIARPDLRVTLVEPLAKRIAFLRTAAAAIGRTDVAIVRERGEALVPKPDRWDVVLSRATLPPFAWLALGGQLIREGGSVWVLLAKEGPPAHQELFAQEDLAYTWPLTGASRRAVRFSRSTR